jgi:predicted histidine transporter YuiF (NhaC family)
MVLEFKRWGVPGLRLCTGLLEILGAIGLLVGQWLPWIGLLSAIGLSLLMVCGLLVRLRIRDSFLQTLPAVVYLAVSVLVAWRFVKSL